MQKKLVIHVGLARAGSTFLQNAIFPRLIDVNYVGKTKNDYPEWLIKWHYQDDLSFIRDAEQIRDAVTERIGNAEISLLSSEMFTMWGGDPGRQAFRIQSLFPDARILFILRHPRSRMLSSYKAMVSKSGAFKPLSELVEWRSPPLVYYKRNPICLSDYRYDDIIGAYGHWFPHDQIEVMYYEDMINDFAGFLRELGRITETTQDVRVLEPEVKHRLNESPETESINDIRVKNLMSLLRNAGVENVKEDQLDALREEVVLSDTAWDKIESAIRSRCSAYYPEDGHGSLTRSFSD